MKTHKIYLRHLKVHMRATISEEEAAQKGLYVYCDRCPKKFTSPTQLRAHVETGMDCIKIGLPGKLTLSKRKGLGEVLFS